MPCRTNVLSAPSTPSLAPYLVIRGPSSWVLLAAVIVLGYRVPIPKILGRLVCSYKYLCVSVSHIGFIVAR